MAIEDTVAAFALVAATSVLAFNTFILYRATNVLAQVEKKRDRRQFLRERISLGESITGMESNLITLYLAGVRQMNEQVADAANSVRRLRAILPKDGDPNLSNLVFSLDYVNMNLDNADGGAELSGVEKEVLKHVENIKSKLKLSLLPKWRAELHASYGD